MNTEELLCKTTITQKRGRHGTQKNSRHDLGEKSRPGLGKMPGSQRSNLSTKEEGETLVAVFPEKRPLERMPGTQLWEQEM